MLVDFVEPIACLFADVLSLDNHSASLLVILF
jgi:hypothetical protein